MANGVFVHREDSIYRDTPAKRYHFPKQYLERARACTGDWIIYYEPVKVPGSRGYWATARVESIVPDPAAEGMYYAIIAPGEFVQFPNDVPLKDRDGYLERGLVNVSGRLSGWAQAAVRPMAREDFIRIINRGIPGNPDLLLRRDEAVPGTLVREDRANFDFGERERVIQLTSRPLRDRAFRRLVLDAYGDRCALTGLRLINGGGRAEAEAAHIQPVEKNGPDLLANGLALSGTVHWMFDRGLISLGDDLEILVSRQVNDHEGIQALLNCDGRARLPIRSRDRPHPQFLSWHREHCFKH